MPACATTSFWSRLSRWLQYS